MVFLWILSTAFWGYQASDLKPDFEFENLFPSNDPDIAFYEKHLEQFGYDNDFMMVIIESEPLFDSTFLNKIILAGDKIERLDGTVSIASPLKISQTVASPVGTLTIPIIHALNPQKYVLDSSKIFQHPFYSSFFGFDGKSLRLQIQHRHFTQPDKAKSYYLSLEEILGKYEFDNYRLVGKISAQEEFIHFIKKDFAVFIGIALLISLLFLFIIFRSLRSAITPYLIAISCLIWVLGLMAITGQPITILGSLIPPIILFVSTSDAIHFLNSYRKSKEQKINKRILKSIKQVFIPTLLTSVTTGIGFLSLWTIGTEPVKWLGIFSGIGVVIAFLMTFILGPILVYGWSPNEMKNSGLKPLSIIMLRNQKLITIASTGVLLLSILGLFKLNVDAYLLDDLPESSSIKQNFEYAENQYFGYKPYEVAYWPVDSSKTIWDQEIMNEALFINEYLNKEYPIGSIWSPISGMKYGNQAINGGIGKYYTFPEDRAFNKAKRALKPIIQQDASVFGTVSKNQKYARIKGFIPELGSKETIARNEKLEEYLNSNIDKTILDYKITGTTYLIDKSHESLSENLINGLMIAIILVSLILGAYYKSLKVLIVSIVPNLLPLVITAGFMGLLGIPLKLTTSIIFAVSFGIAVDDTIHFISAYLKAPHSSKIYKTIYAYNSAGSAIIITSIIIIAGFGIFLFSSFGATFYLGLFLCLTLASATLIDLTLLPIILNFLNKKENS